VDFCNSVGIEPWVSSESVELLDSLQDANVIKRPEALAADDIRSLAVAKHAMEKLEITDYWTYLLEPTSPWRYLNDLQRCADETNSKHWCVATAEPVKTVQGPNVRFNGAAWLLGPLNSWFSNDNIQLVFTDYRPNIDHEIDFHIAANLMPWHREFHAKWLMAYTDSLRSQTPSSPQTTHKAPESSIQ
jgi:CMP-N-acetylneuraminic acid synthetase